MPRPGSWQNNPNHPVNGVSWNDVQVFLSRLNDMEQTAGRLPNGWKYVLPTEAQWEYACRAGTTTAYSWGEMISILPVPIIIGMADRMTETILSKPLGLSIPPTPGLFRHARKCLGMGT